MYIVSVAKLCTNTCHSLIAIILPSNRSAISQPYHLHRVVSYWINLWWKVGARQTINSCSMFTCTKSQLHSCAAILLIHWSLFSHTTGSTNCQHWVEGVTGSTSGGKRVQTKPPTELQVPPRPTNWLGNYSFISGRHVKIDHTQYTCADDEVTRPAMPKTRSRRQTDHFLQQNLLKSAAYPLLFEKMKHCFFLVGTINITYLHFYIT